MYRYEEAPLYTKVAPDEELVQVIYLVRGRGGHHTAIRSKKNGNGAWKELGTQGFGAAPLGTLVDLIYRASGTGFGPVETLLQGLEPLDILLHVLPEFQKRTSNPEHKAWAEQGLTLLRQARGPDEP